jgi:tetratricopeptide (TPR) repeat protein
VALTSVAFAPVIHNQFVNWDDYKNFVNNPHFRGLGSAQLRWMFSTFHMGQYQPLSWLTYGIDYQIWGLNPLGYHLTNVCFHIANALLFYGMAMRLFTRASRWSSARIRFGAAVAAMLFAVHPLRVESVAWATERRDVLSGFFFLLTLHFYCGFLDREATGSRRWLLYVASLIAFTGSLFSKATAVGLPLILWAIDVFPFQRPGIGNRRWLGPVTGRYLFEKLPFVAVASVATIVAIRAQTHAMTITPLSSHGLPARFVQSGFGLCFYLWKTIVPTDLTPLVPLPNQAKLLGSPFVELGIAGWSVVLVLLLVRGRWPTLATIAICYVVLLLPVMGLVQIGSQLVADRYSYLSCLGFALLGGAAAVQLSMAQRIFGRSAFAVSLAVTSTALITLCVLTRQQVQQWDSSLKLWLRAVQIHPDSATAHLNLGTALIDLGRDRESIVQFQRVLELEPSAFDANLNLGKAFFKLQRWGQAAANFEKAAALKPNDAESWNYVGAANLQLQRLEKAILAFQIAMELQPANGTVAYNLGRAQMMSGNAKEALAAWRRAQEVMPESPLVLQTLAWHLATLPDDSLRNGPEAVALAERACRITDFQDADCMDALAAAYAESGRYQEAARLAQQAIAVARASQRARWADEIEARLKSYQSHQPYREAPPKLEY